MPKKSKLTNRPLPRNENEKELVIIGDSIEFNNPKETFKDLADCKRWDIGEILEQVKHENRPPGIYLYNIVQKEVVAYTELNQEELERTCRYFDIEVPDGLG